MGQTTMPNFTAEWALEAGYGTYVSTRNYGDGGQGVTPQVPPWLIATKIMRPPLPWAEYCSIKRYPKNVQMAPDEKFHVVWNCVWVCGNSTLLTWECAESIA